RNAALICRLWLACIIAIFLLPAAPAQAQMMRGTVSVSTADGFARLIFTFPQDNDADVRIASGIAIIRFKRPVDVSVDRLAAAAPSYIAAARRDPDGTAVRLALSRRVTVNSIAAGEQFIVDLLPDTWVGLPPGVPQDVIDNLVRRANQAERKARQDLLAL